MLKEGLYVIILKLRYSKVPEYISVSVGAWTCYFISSVQATHFFFTYDYELFIQTKTTFLCGCLATTPKPLTFLIARQTLSISSAVKRNVTQTWLDFRSPPGEWSVGEIGHQLFQGSLSNRHVSFDLLYNVRELALLWSFQTRWLQFSRLGFFSFKIR